MGAGDVNYIVRSGPPQPRFPSECCGKYVLACALVIVSTDPHENDIVAEHLTKTCTRLCDSAATGSANSGKGIRHWHGGEEGLTPQGKKRSARTARRYPIVIKPETPKPPPQF